MGNLPKNIVSKASQTGPFRVSPYRKSGTPVKIYVCLFVCLATKAIHLEAVYDLRTSNFLQSFKQFLSRRGVVSEMYSDNGTNFIGAKAEVHDFYKLINSVEYNKYRAIRISKSWNYLENDSTLSSTFWWAVVISYKIS